MSARMTLTCEGSTSREADELANMLHRMGLVLDVSIPRGSWFQDGDRVGVTVDVSWPTMRDADDPGHGP